MNHRILIGIFCMVMLVGGVGSADTIDFEGISTSGGWAFLPANYDGFDWSVPGHPTERWEICTYSYYNSTYSQSDTWHGSNFAYNDSGSLVMMMSDSSDFTLTSLLADSWRNTNNQTSTSLTITGYNNGSLVGSTLVNFASSPAGMGLVTLGWNAPVDSVTFTASAEGKWWRVDDITYTPFNENGSDNSVVPEPASMGILGFGLLGLAATRMRRKVA